MKGGDYANADYDVLIVKAASRKARAARYNLLHQAGYLLISEQAVIPLSYNTSTALMVLIKGVFGFQIS